MALVVEVLVEVFEVTEWRDGCVYRTKSRGHEWVTREAKNHPPEGLIYASPSTSHEGPTIRSVPVK